MRFFKLIDGISDTIAETNITDDCNHMISLT